MKEPEKEIDKRNSDNDNNPRYISKCARDFASRLKMEMGKYEPR